MKKKNSFFLKNTFKIILLHFFVYNVRRDFDKQKIKKGRIYHMYNAHHDFKTSENT